MKTPIQETIQEAVHKAWTDAKSALQGVHDEVNRRVRQAMDKADLRQGSEEAQRLLADFGKRLQQNGEAAGQRLEEIVGRIRGPLLDEVGRLRSRAEELGQRIESRLRRKDGGSGGEGGASQS